MSKKEFSEGDVIKFLKPVSLRKLERAVFSTHVVDRKDGEVKSLDGLYLIESTKFEPRASLVRSGENFSARKIYARLLSPDKIYDPKNDSVGFNVNNEYWGDYVSPEDIEICDKMVRTYIKV